MPRASADETQHTQRKYKAQELLALSVGRTWRAPWKRGPLSWASKVAKIPSRAPVKAATPEDGAQSNQLGGGCLDEPQDEMNAIEMGI